MQLFYSNSLLVPRHHSRHKDIDIYLAFGAVFLPINARGPKWHSPVNRGGMES